MKTLSSAGQAAIAAPVVPIAVLIEMAFATPLNLCTSNLSLVVGGVTYTGVGSMGQISAVQNTPAEIKQLQFELSGVPPAMVSLVLTAPIQGTPCDIKMAIFNPSTLVVTDTITLWAGALDTMVINETATGSSITVTAEHVGIDLNRSAPSYYTDADQQTLHPGDLFLQYVSQQFDQAIIWPAAAYWRK